MMFAMARRLQKMSVAAAPTQASNFRSLFMFGQPQMLSLMATPSV